MSLTSVQRRTLETIIEPGERRSVPPDLVGDLRTRMAEVIGTETVGGGVTINKTQIGALDRCDGQFVAAILNEGPPFEYSVVTAVGAVLHRAIQSEVQLGGAEQVVGTPEDACWDAAAHLAEHRKEFAAYWRPIDAATREEVVRRAAPMVATFRTVFPPIKPRRAELAPSAEFKLTVDFLGGNVRFVGRPDLALGRLEPGLWSRVVIDHKTGGASSSQMEDLRFYALLQTLGTKVGVPPFRIATYLAEGGTFQTEEVTEETLVHAADRAARAGRRAIEVLEGDDVRTLHPGPWCRWCPRSASCPQADRDAVAADGA